jgi:hypothetical protein
VLRLYDEANKSLVSGDEERAFILFYRFFDSYCSVVKKSKDFENKKYFESMISKNKVQEVVTQLEKITNSVENRYLVLRESEELRAKEIAESNDELVKNSTHSNESITNDSIKPSLNDNSYPTIDCIELLESIENSTEITKILILDTRTTEEYNESHIDKLKTTGDITIANIPETLLSAGLTASKLESLLPYGHSRDAFNRRRQMNKVVIVDKFSTELIPNSAAFFLAEAVWKVLNSIYLLKMFYKF